MFDNDESEILNCLNYLFGMIDRKIDSWSVINLALICESGEYFLYAAKFLLPIKLRIEKTKSRLFISHIFTKAASGVFWWIYVEQFH